MPNEQGGVRPHVQRRAQVQNDRYRGRQGRLLQQGVLPAIGRLGLHCDQLTFTEECYGRRHHR